MAVLNEVQRQAASDEMEDSLSSTREEISLGRQDLRAAINAADDWINSNAVSFNNGLPTRARANLTVKQKAQLLVYVIRRRWEIS